MAVGGDAPLTTELSNAACLLALATAKLNETDIEQTFVRSHAGHPLNDAGDATALDLKVLA